MWADHAPLQMEYRRLLRSAAIAPTIRMRRACRRSPRKEHPLKPVLIDSSDLTPQQRTRGINAILVGQFFVMGGFFMVIPLMAVHYVENLGWAAGTIGIILALRQFFQQSITAFFGVLCDRIGPKPLLLGGMLLRVVAFVALGLS